MALFGRNIGYVPPVACYVGEYRDDGRFRVVRAGSILTGTFNPRPETKIIEDCSEVELHQILRDCGYRSGPESKSALIQFIREVVPVRRM